MTHEEAVDFLEPAVPARSGDEPATWVDAGAGSGTFTLALAELLPDGSRIRAVDRDGGALRRLRRAARALPRDVAVETRIADFGDLGGVVADLPPLDGVLFANALHYHPDPGPLLDEAARRVRTGGRILVIEYDGRPPNRAVPHIIGRERLEELADAIGLNGPDVVSRRPSRYGGFMYCAWLEV